MAKAKCTVRFEHVKGQHKVDAVLYSTRTGYALNYVAMFTPLTMTKARQARALLMRGCDELSRKIRPARRVSLGRSRRRR